MSEIRVNKVIDEAGTGSVELTQGATLPNSKNITGAGGINITGAIVAQGGVQGTLTGTASTSTSATNAYGLSGAPNISVGTIGAGNVTSSGDISAVNGTYTGNLNVAGTLTYEDMTNQDVVGLSTFRAGVDFNGFLREEVKITAGKLSDNLNINLDDGMVHLFTVAETTTSTPNIISATGINTSLAVGDAFTVSVITTAAAGGFSAQWKIDGLAATEVWNGGAAPAAGGSSGKDFYTLNIIKTGNEAFTVLGNVSNFA
tara:strand:+ start:135 stop:908 length:774 start_codon:yes stop_codon:yes gene_type:complete